MNIDFHYYATYAAARLAGYDADDARTIAHAAQYVDESDSSLIVDKDSGPGHKPLVSGPDWEPVPTVQQTTDQAYMNLAAGQWNEASITNSNRIWIPFHFLPGNYDSTPDNKAYGGVDRHEGSELFGQFWEYNREEEHKFQLLCLPNSPLAEKMINDVKDNHKGSPHELHLLGLRMHVLADTWAHRYYAGIMAWFMNDAAEDVFEVVDGKEKAVNWDPISALTASRDPSNWRLGVPDVIHYNSVAYLGHGRMGHLPDIPCMTYKYAPQWAGKTMVKDNPETFLRAFGQLVEAMRCVRTNQDFCIGNYADLGGNKALIDGIFRTRVEDQSGIWRERIPLLRMETGDSATPPPFERERWRNEHKDAQGKDRTDYYHFNHAAALHLKLVTEFLNGKGIHLLDPESQPRHEVRLGHEGRYVGPLEEAANLSTASKQYYPTLGSSPISLRITSHARSAGELRSGDIVTIETPEKSAGQYNFLGAWSTPALYYYTRDWDYNKQRWTLEKVGAGEGEPIRNGDRIYLRNRFYRDEPYLAPKGGYLTTSSEKTEWTLEMTA